MAAGSALLLGIGGWLVVQGQLTVGQLVAAELILGTIFLNMGNFPSVLESWYSLRPAVEKLAELYQLAPEEPHGEEGVDQSWAPSLTFEGALLSHRQRELTLSAHFPAGSTTLVAPETVSVTEAFCSGATQLQLPRSGLIRFGEREAETLHAGELRDEVVVVSDTMLIACTISEFMQIGNPALTRGEIMKALAVTGLANVVDGLPDGLDTPPHAQRRLFHHKRGPAPEDRSGPLAYGPKNPHPRPHL
jgi:ABC-type bacteriocin/lantibiotic exporters, contain an N-terminal double-glycine peptidase domain